MLTVSAGDESDFTISLHKQTQSLGIVNIRQRRKEDLVWCVFSQPVLQKVTGAVDRTGNLVMENKK